MARNVLLDDEVVVLAEAQHGAFAPSQLPPGWCSSRLATERAERGEWVHICHGVYGVPGLLDDWTVPAAWCLAVPTAALGLVGAAQWWRLDGVPPGVMQLLAPHDCRTRQRFLRRTRDLAPWEVRLDRPDGCLRLTDPTRTLIDVAAMATADELERMVESALRQGLTSTARLRARATQLRRPGRTGPSELLAVLDRRPRGGGADSDGEVIFLQRLRAAGVPEPERQVRLGSTFFDLGWPERKVLVELDGRRSQDRLRRDARKQNAAVLAGWTVLRFTWDRVEDEIEAVVAEVLAALAA